MKKILTFVCAAMVSLCTTVNAKVVMTESFDREAGQLSLGANTSMSTNTSDWWSYSGTSNYIQVAEGSMSYAGYKTTGVGNKASMVSGTAADDFRKFASAVTSGKVYLAAIINVDDLRQSTSGDYFLSLGNGGIGGTDVYARLSTKSVSDGTNYYGFQLGLNKVNESTTFMRYTSQVYSPKTDYLVVVEYEFVDGEKNDEVRLYVNPTKATTKPTLVCVQDTTNAAGTSSLGANTKADASQIAAVYLRQGSNTPRKLYVDEIKVTTSWNELFEEGGSGGGETSEGVIVSDDKIMLGADGYTYSHKTYSKTLTVLAENLTQDITITHVNNAVALSVNKLGKDGGEYTLTLDKPQNEGYGYDTITFTSGSVSEKTCISWYNTLSYSTLASLKAAYANDDEYGSYCYSGEAVVTRRYEMPGYPDNYGVYYIQDATGAIELTNEWEQASELEVGDKITELVGYAGEENSAGIKPLIIAMDPELVGMDCTVDPVSVSLAELQSNANAYLVRLVKLEGVTLDQKGEVFKAGSKVGLTQGGKSANLQPINDAADYIGLAIPEQADIIGFSVNNAGTVIVPRDKNDIITKGGGTGVANTKAKAGTRKMIRNGQLVIIRGDKEINVLGTQL